MMLSRLERATCHTGNAKDPDFFRRQQWGILGDVRHHDPANRLDGDGTNR